MLMPGNDPGGFIVTMLIGIVGASIGPLLSARAIRVAMLGAEVLHPRGATVGSTQDLASLLTHSLGAVGGILIYLGIFAAVGSSVVAPLCSATGCWVWNDISGITSAHSASVRSDG